MDICLNFCSEKQFSQTLRHKFYISLSISLYIIDRLASLWGRPKTSEKQPYNPEVKSK